MNNRLEKISSYIVDGIGVADIGTDHGFLPIALCERGYSGNIIAADINSDPLNKAIRAAKQAGVYDRISFLLCDGLEKCNNALFDRVVIAGMGGDTIAGIIERAPNCFSDSFTFHLQPMSKAEILRGWLLNHGFGIINEDLVVDNDTIYQIISAKFGVVSSYCDAELYIGKKELHSDKDLYEKLRLKHIDRFEKAVDGMSAAENRDMSEKILEMKVLLEQFRRIG